MQLQPMNLEALERLIVFAADRPISRIGLDTNLYTELEFDSLNAVALSVELERDYGIRVPDDALRELHTPRQILEFLERVAARSRDGAAADPGP